VHAPKQLAPKVADSELLKETGLEHSDALVTQAAEFPPAMLIGFLDGS
jgi:hypothetical protein